jgi:hypothetical protein
MQKSINSVADNFNTMRTGRANPAILDRIQVGHQVARWGLPCARNAFSSVVKEAVVARALGGITHCCYRVVQQQPRSARRRPEWGVQLHVSSVKTHLVTDHGGELHTPAVHRWLCTITRACMTCHMSRT